MPCLWTSDLLSGARLMARWCECRSTIGYTTLYDPQNIYVCVECYRPAILVFEKYIKVCVECGVTFSNPWERVCAPCRDELLFIAQDCDGEDRVWLLENVSSTSYQTWESHAAKARDIVESRRAPGTKTGRASIRTPG